MCKGKIKTPTTHTPLLQDVLHQDKGINQERGKEDPGENSKKRCQENKQAQPKDQSIQSGIGSWRSSKRRLRRCGKSE